MFSLAILEHIVTAVSQAMVTEVTEDSISIPSLFTCMGATGSTISHGCNTTSSTIISSLIISITSRASPVSLSPVATVHVSASGLSSHPASKRVEEIQTSLFLIFVCSALYF